MKRKIVIGLLSVLLYGLFLILLMPARVLLAFITLPNEITLHQVNGTLWQGEALDAVVLDQPVDAIRWQIVWKGIQPILRMDIQVEKDIEMQANIKFQTPVMMTDVKLNADMARLHQRAKSFITANQSRFPKNAPAINQFNQLPIEISGHMALEVDAFSAGFAQCHTLIGQVNFSHLTLDAFGINVELDEVSSPLKCQNNQLKMKFNQLSDQLASILSLELNIKTGAYQLKGQLEPKEEISATLKGLVNQLPGTQTMKQISKTGKL